MHPLVSPATILSQDSTRRYSCISDLVGSPSDLRISSVTLGPSTFGFSHWIGSLRIYFRSSLDLSDSSSILEIGHSSEILRISKTLYPSCPLSLSPPLFPYSPFPFLPPPLGCLLIFVLRGLPFMVDPQPFHFAHPLDPSPTPHRSSPGIHPLAVYLRPVTLSSTIVLIQVLGYDSLSTVRVSQHVQTWSVRTNSFVYIPS